MEASSFKLIPGSELHQGGLTSSKKTTNRGSRLITRLQFSGSSMTLSAFTHVKPRLLNKKSRPCLNKNNKVT